MSLTQASPPSLPVSPEGSHLSSEERGNLRIGIFSPPLVEPFQPSLTLPYLSAQLRDFGFQPVCHNLSSLFYLWLFRRSRLSSMSRYRELREAMETLRDFERFCEPDRYHEALQCLDGYVASLSESEHLPYSLFPESRASVVEQGTDVERLMEAIPGSLLEHFLVDYVGFTLQLESYDVLGFSATNAFQLASACFLARTLKTAGAEALLTLGGHAISVARVDLAEKDGILAAFDSIVVGGGADVFATVLEDHVRGRKKEKSLYLSGEAAPHYRFKRSGFPTEHPYDLILQHDINDLYLSPAQVFSIYSALGCSYGECTFCGSNKANGPYVPRYASVLVDEIELLQKRYGIRHFTMCDNNFDPKRAASFCAELERRGVRDVFWQCTSRIYRSLDAPLLQRLRKVGCVMVNIGLESASDRILDLMKKGYTAADAQKQFNDVRQAGMPMHSYCICGFPSETAEDSETTLDFLRRNLDACHSIYFQDYEGQLATKVFNDTIGTDTDGYPAAVMIERLFEEPTVRKRFVAKGSLLRRRGYPFIEDHNFLYLAHEQEVSK